MPAGNSFFSIAALVSFIIFAAVATVFDLRERRIPDVLNFFFLVVAVGLVFSSGSFSTAYLLFIAASFIFAYALYRLGAWAGGDAKFFTAATAFLPLFGIRVDDAFYFLSFAWVFIASALLLVPALVLVYWKKLFGARKKIFSAALNAVRPAASGALAAAGTTFILSRALYASESFFLVFAVLFFFYLIRIPFWAGVVLAFFSAYYSPVQTIEFFVFFLAVLFLARFSRVVHPVISKRVFIKKIKAKDLVEGMIPAQTVFLRKGKPVAWRPSVKELVGAALSGKFPGPPGRIVADSSRAAGLSPNEIRELKRLGVKYLPVRESIPFTPVLAVGELVFVVVAWLAAS